MAKMIWTNVLLIALAVPVLVLLPGYLIAARYGGPRSRLGDPVERLASTLGFGLFGAAPVYFLVGALVCVPVGWRLIGPVWLALMVVLGPVARERFAAARESRRAPGGERGEARDPWVRRALCLSGFVLVLQFLAFDGPRAFDLLCTYKPCALASGLDDAEGSTWGASNPSLFYPEHQRMGVTAVITPWMALFGMTGIRLFWGLLFALVPLALFSAARRLRLQPPDAFFASALASLLPGLAGLQDQNRILFAMTCFLAHLMTWRLDRPWLLGAVLGLVWAAEPMMVLSAPALVAALLSDPSGLWRGRAMGRASFLRLAGGFVLMAFPAMLRLWWLTGSPFSHEHFSYVPALPYELLGLGFRFHGYLNWPLHSELVRSPYNPVPNLAFLPIRVLDHFGVLLFSVCLCGLSAALARKRLRLVAVLLLFIVPLAGFLALNENWTDEDKWDIVVMTYAPLFLLAGLGFSWLRRGAAPLPARLGAFLGVAVIAWCARLALPHVNAQYDHRFVESWAEPPRRFAPEDPVYLEAEREKIRRVHLLPALTALPIPTLSGMRYALHDLEDLSIRKRQASFQERFQQTVAREGSEAVRLKPDGFDREAASMRARDWPARFTLDLNRPVNDGLRPPFTEPLSPPPCSDPDPWPLYPYDRLRAVRVDWNPWPVHVGVVFSEDLAWGALVVMRNLPLDRQFPIQTGGEIPAACVAVHLPPEANVIVMDFPIMLPTRGYMYDVATPAGPAGPVELKPVW